MTLAIGIDDILRAAEILQGVAHRTPVLRSRSVDALTGAQVFFKAENLQRMGAFKFRGAYHALSRLSPAQRRQGAIAFSSGNHGQAVALSARLLGMPSVIVMPQDAPAVKISATRGYQAGQPASEVVLYDRWRDDREAIGRQLAQSRGMTLIPPFDHADVMAGAGTAALELIEQVSADGGLDALLVCVGGGGLISGCAIAAHARQPDIEVWGVEPEAGNDVQQSLAAGAVVRIGMPRTIADGAQTQACGALTFPVIRERVRGVVTVTDTQLLQTVRFMAERMKQVVEPTGALAAAALLHRAAGLPDWRGRRVGVIISGGNVDMVQLAGWLAAPPSPDVPDQGRIPDGRAAL